MRRILTALRRKIASLRPRRRVLVPAPVPARRSTAPRGLTLVEMLVTVAITLIMMAAVVNVFASIGQGVQHRRASIEVGNQLRIARSLLAQDLGRATATTLPPRDPSSGEGYLEIIEGIHTDWYPTRLADGEPSTTGGIDAAGNSELDPTDPSVVPSGALASDSDVLIPSSPLGLSGLGDFDDVLALTVRSNGEPFIGRFGNTTIKSYEAEIIWYAVENPAAPGAPELDLGEPGMRTIYRRVLLIAPWVDSDPALPTSLTVAAADLGVQYSAADPEIWRKFYRNFDVTVRVDPATGRWTPNSLSDLTKRENRFAHLADFPHTMDVRRIRHTDAAVYDSTVNDNQKSQTPLVPFGTSMEYDKRTKEGIIGTAGSFDTNDTRFGEDVILTNVLAFDLRVFDPGAPLFEVGGTVLEPSDIGWQQQFTTNTNPTVVGRGAYVDLAYARDLTDPIPSYDVTNSVGSQYSGPPIEYTIGKTGFQVPLPGFASPLQNSMRFLIRSAYDAWSFHYEYDGINQDGDDFIDEGANGVDDDGVGGIDDIGERETLPPYLSALRGMEAKIRIYEPDSRVVREVSVKQNFTPQ